MIACSPKYLIHDLQLAIDDAAIENPANAMLIPPMRALRPQYIAIMRSSYWGAAGAANLTVSFLDNPNAATKKKILQYANLWRKTANIKFVESSDGIIRIAREDDGYWSYLGTDIKQIPRGQPTMNLQGFTERTSDSEYSRVVTHEFGHTLGMPHEHMRRDIVARIDPAKAYKYFQQTQGWSRQMVQQQVLTPLEESSLFSTARANVDSIMCYQLPGSIMKDGIAVPGGNEITQVDYDFVRKLHPRLK